MTMTTLFRLLGIKGDFQQLFYTNEYKTLAGERRQTILTLIFILFLTLLALGYAVGSIKNLEAKMNDPFTNWVDLSIRNDFIAKKIPNIKRDYGSEKKQKDLKLDDLRGWVKFNLGMYHQDFDPTRHSTDTLLFNTWGRTLELDDPLMERIISEDNSLWINPDINPEENEGLRNCEIIISEEMISRLGYAPDNPSLGYIFISDENSFIPVKIMGVVKELPKFCNFICAPGFYNIKNIQFADGVACGKYIEENGRSNVYSFIASTDTKVENVRQLSKGFFKTVRQPDIRVNDDIEIISGIQNWQVYEFSFGLSDTIHSDTIKKFLEFTASEKQALVDVRRILCNTNDCIALEEAYYHYLAFNFNRLDDIRAFKDDIKSNHAIDIDMSQVEAKENFAAVSRMTFIISLVLLGFGILSIILFVNNLLRTHLFRVRSNLGTFKAFGLSNSFLNSIYAKIIVSFLLISIFIAFTGTVMVEGLEYLWMQEESRFNIFNWWVLVALVGLILISMYISSRTIRKILGDTPGNLIYER